MTSLLNHLVNHPDIKPAVAPAHAGYVNMLRAGKNMPNVHVVGDEDGAIFLAVNHQNVAEWHWLCTRKLRGMAALELARRAITLAFTTLNVHAIIGATPRSNCAARVMNRALGARPVGTSTDSQGRECVNYILDRAQWAIF